MTEPLPVKRGEADGTAKWCEGVMPKPRGDVPPPNDLEIGNRGAHKLWIHLTPPIRNALPHAEYWV